MFRSLKRQRRYDRLLGHGFLKGEARVLSKVPRRTPYFPTLIASRASLLAMARRKGWSKEEYERYIKQGYFDHGWTKRDKLLRQVLDPWAMLRKAEDAWKAKHPAYKSPWEAKSYVSKARLEKSDEKQAGITARRLGAPEWQRVQWIKQLEGSISQAKTEYRREQLRGQRRRLILSLGSR